ncbi:MAG: CvpA family protein [Bacteroidota bacterium]
MNEADNISLNVFDLIVVGVILFGMYKGYAKGLVKQTVGLIGVAFSALIGFRFYYLLVPFFENNFYLPENIVLLLSFAGVFTITLVVISFASNTLDGLLTKMHLGGISKALGALSGGYLSALALSGLLWALSVVNIPSRASVEDSVTYPHIRTFVVDNLKYGLQVLPVAKEALNKLDNVVREDPGPNPPPPASPTRHPKPDAIR